MARLDEIWSSDWKTRLYERLAARGYTQVSEWLAARPGAPYAQLAAEMGDDVAPVQVTRLQLAEALRAGHLREASKDVLVRYIREAMPDGWRHKPRGSESFELDFLQVAPFADWAVRMDEAAPAEAAAFKDAVWRGLQAISDETWLPRDAHDPFIGEIFDRAWPLNAVAVKDENKG